MLIGIAGPKGVGKTTVADALATHLGATRISFADPLKHMMRTLLLYTEAGKLPEDKAAAIPELQGRDLRYLLQTLGTEWGRNLVGTNIWTDLARTRLRRLGDVIIDDVRFPSERDMIHEEGGLVIGLRRSGVEYTMEHESEVPLSGVKYLENNEGIVERIAAML